MSDVTSTTTTAALELHAAVLANDVKRVAALLRTTNRNDLARRDVHGNSALHLAVMCGHRECVQLLLSHSAPVAVKNGLGWTPLAEAVAYGDRTTIACLLRRLKAQSREAMDARRPRLVAALRAMADFRLELRWDFQSWLPLVSRVLPSDVCRVAKKGASLRLDTTLVDFSDMQWERGDVSFLFAGDARASRALTLLDNKLRVYQTLRLEESEQELEDEVDLLMGSDVVAAQMSTKSIAFARAHSGWLWREQRQEMVGPFLADFYSVSGLVLESRKRREHLTDDDLSKNKAILESLTRAGGGVQQAYPTARRKSLTPPPPTTVTWQEYASAPPGQHPPLGRAPVCKESVKAFKATLAMSEQFPMSVESLLNVLEVIAPFKHFAKLRDFVAVKLPPGFPVKIDIPIVPTVTARITFQSFELDADIDDALFAVPADYSEDANRFPDL